MSENINENEALRREADPRDNLIESLIEQLTRANMRLIVREQMENPEPAAHPAGIRVIDRKEAHEYPSATSAEVGDEGTLTVWQRTGDDQRPVAIFHSWDHVERINPIKYFTYTFTSCLVPRTTDSRCLGSVGSVRTDD